MKHRLALAGVALASVLAGTAVVAPKSSAQDTAGDVAKRKVRTRIEPKYPELASEMKLAGRVKIEATIAADGRVVSTRVVGGSPMLVNAAVNALKQWRFEPAANESTETFVFDFNPSGAQTD
jgi:TonB family protein